MALLGIALAASILPGCGLSEHRQIIAPAVRGQPAPPVAAGPSNPRVAPRDPLAPPNGVDVPILQPR